MSNLQDVPSVNKHLSKVVQYNVPNGKKNRGMSVPVSYKMMVPVRRIIQIILFVFLIVFVGIRRSLRGRRRA